MSAGGITIEDDVQIAANVQLISNNHDPYDRMVIICKPVLIKKKAWIGAGQEQIRRNRTGVTRRYEAIARLQDIRGRLNDLLTALNSRR
jgi:hypothetical protein